MSREEMRIPAAERPNVLARQYLGDGAYIAWDGFGLWLTAEDGQRATDVIYLEPEVWRALRDFVQDIHKAHTKRTETT